MTTRTTESDFIVYSGGFDCQIIGYSVKKDKVVHTVRIGEVLSSFNEVIQKQMITPHIYSLSYDHQKSALLVSLETGNVIGLAKENLSQRLFCLEGHYNKVIRRWDKKRVF